MENLEYCYFSDVQAYRDYLKFVVDYYNLHPYYSDECDVGITITGKYFEDCIDEFLDLDDCLTIAFDTSSVIASTINGRIDVINLIENVPESLEYTTIIDTDLARHAIKKGWIVKDVNLKHETNTTETTGKTTMTTSIKKTATATLTTNKDAALLAAKVAVGKAGNKVITKAIKPKLPLMARGYADGVVGSLVAANVAQIAVNQFMPDNRKAKIIADAMVQAAMLDLLGEIDIEGMMDSMLDKVKGTKVDKLLKASDEDLGLDD